MTALRPSYRWTVIVGLFSALSSSAFLISYSVGIMLPGMRADLHMSPAQAGALGGIGWLATIVLGIPVAAFVSRYNPRLMTFLSGVHMAVFALLQGWAPTYELELLFRFVFMIGFVSRQANMAMLVQRWFTTEEVPLLQSVVNVINGGAQIAAVALMPWLLIWLDGWRNTFYALALLLGAASLLWLVASRDRPVASPAGPEQRERTPLVAVFRYQPVWVFGISGAFCLVGTSAFSVFWPTFLVEERGLSLRMAGLFTAGIPAGAIVGAVSATWVRGLVTARRQQFYVTGAVCSVSMVVMAVSPVAALMPLGAFGLGWACMQATPTLMAIPYELPGIKPREVAVVTSFMISLFTIGGVIGPVLVGAVEQAGGSLQLALLLAALTHVGIFSVAVASEAGLPPLPRVQRRRTAVAVERA